MRNSATRFILALLAAFTVASVSAAGMARWLQSEYDFGTFKEEVGKVSCKMLFVNVGDSAIVITNVRPTCGCTAGDYTHSPIAPGDTGAIYLTYNPYGRPGKFHKDVIVMMNCAPIKSIISIKGNVIGSESTIKARYPVSVGSLKLNTTIVPFGQMQKGKTRVAYLDGYNQSNDTLKVTFDSVPPYLRADAIPPLVPPGGLCTITVYHHTGLNPDWGLSQSLFGISCEPLHPAKAESGKAKITVTAVITEDFSQMSESDRKEAPVQAISADKLDFATLSRTSSQPVTRTFTIDNYGKSPLLIHRIYSTDPYISVSVSDSKLKKGKQATVEVTVNPQDITDKMLNSQLSVITNDPQNPLTSIRIVGVLSK
jgi:hypothetical protein